MYPSSNGQSSLYQQSRPAGGILSPQPSFQTYSELKCDFSDEGRFSLNMYTISSVGFVLNLIFTFSLMTFLLWPQTPNALKSSDKIVECHALGNSTEKTLVREEEMSCSKLTTETIRKYVLEDCDDNSNDEIRVHPLNYSRSSKGDRTSLIKWEVGLNHSSVSLDSSVLFTVQYSGIYILQSSLAFECNSLANPSTEEQLYWQEIQVDDVTRFRDVERIQGYSLEFRPSFCYRSYIYALLRLRAKSSFRIFAGPTELIRYTRKMSYLALYRP